ncbi:MAG: aquaporin [Dehalococcoidia bacterium]
MNPACSFGPALVAWTFSDLWLYLTAPVLGALAGALLYVRTVGLARAGEDLP